VSVIFLTCLSTHSCKSSLNILHVLFFYTLFYGHMLCLIYCDLGVSLPNEKFSLPVLYSVLFHLAFVYLIVKEHDWA